MDADRHEPLRDAVEAAAPDRRADTPASSDEWFFEDLHALVAEPLSSFDDVATEGAPIPADPRRSFRDRTQRRSKPATTARAARPRGGRLEQRLLLVLAVAVVLALALGIAVAAKVHADRQQAADDARTFESSIDSASPLIAVVGDRDLMQGAGVSATRRWPALVQDAVGGDLVQLASPGMGYLARGTSGGTFRDQIARIPKAADVVLFVSGTTDAGADTLSVLKSATAAYSAAAARAPHARIAVIGPALVAKAADAQLANLRRSLRLAAETAGVRWVDPLQDRWLGLRAQSITSASALTESDQRILAERLTTLVQRLES